MNTYKVKSSAQRAAKKEFGADYASLVDIIEVNGEWTYEMKPQQEIDAALKSTIETTQLLADVEQEEADKAAKKAEIESRKPVHIPASLPESIVAKKSAPASIPALPAFLKIAPPAAEEVPEAAPIEDQAALQAAADKLADAQAVNDSVEPMRPRLSTTDKPTKKVWHVADSMPGAKRKDVIEECVRQGIAYGTARTQYQHWFKTMNDSKAAPIAVIGKDGKITMPGKE